MRLTTPKASAPVEASRGAVSARGRADGLSGMQALADRSAVVQRLAALQPQDRGARATGGVIQRQTRVYYAPPNDRDGDSLIDGIDHRRVLHNTTQRDLAAYRSGYDDHADATAHGAGICNHYVSYAAIRDAVLDELDGGGGGVQDLDDAVNWVEGTFDPNVLGAAAQHNGAFGYAFGAVPPSSINDAAMAPPPGQFDEFEVEAEFNDMIFNLANDPRNLFYWPASSGADPDVPDATVVANGSANGNTVGAAGLTADLDVYRTYLGTTLGLAVP